MSFPELEKPSSCTMQDVEDETSGHENGAAASLPSHRKRQRAPAKGSDRGSRGPRSSVRLRSAHYTNLDGQVSGAEAPLHPLLLGGRALIWALSAVELLREEQQGELEMTDREGLRCATMDLKFF